MGNISYTGVALNEKSREILLTAFKHLLPDNWEWVGHHMTICLGALKEELRAELLDTSVYITVESLGISDMAMAVGVSGVYSLNEKPHITLGVNRIEGGKPYMSNEITEWKPLTENLIVSGIIKEFKMVEKTKITDIADLPFLEDVKLAGGKIYQVGGAVR